MPKRTRERQLAKLAARRHAEKARQRRRRNIALGAGGVAVGVVLLVVGINLLTGPDSSTAANSPSATASTSGSPSPSAGPSPCGSPKPPASASEKKPTFSKPPPMTIDVNKRYTATFKTSCGSFTVALLPKVAPIGVNNFVFLADKGFYDGLTFHRIVKNFVIQGGDPKGDGTGGPGYHFKIETSKKQTFDSAGLLAYANSGPNTNASQFFVTLGPEPNLNPTPQASYTIFGDVTRGLDVVKKIGTVPTVAGPACPAGENCSPTEPVFILSVTINES
jgi:cyclophilin family peptidyl-prolyl cis-trans isomerase